MFSIKCEIRYFHIVEVQKWQTSVQKVLWKLLFCLLNLLFFLTFSFLSCCWILKTLLSKKTVADCSLKITMYMTNFLCLFHTISWDKHKKTCECEKIKVEDWAKTWGRAFLPFPTHSCFFFAHSDWEPRTFYHFCDNHSHHNITLPQQLVSDKSGLIRKKYFLFIVISFFWCIKWCFYVVKSLI